MNEGAENKDCPWVYANGTWSRLDHDPVPVTEGASESWDEAIKAAGYEVWFSTGADADWTDLPLRMTVHVRHTREPYYLFDLQSYLTETAFAATLPDAMALIERWAPAVQAVTVTGQLSRAASGDEVGVVAEIFKAAGLPRAGRQSGAQ